MNDADGKTMKLVRHFVTSSTLPMLKDETWSRFDQETDQQTNKDQSESLPNGDE